MKAFRSVPLTHIQRQTYGSTRRRTTLLCYTVNAVNSRVSYRKRKYVINGDQLLFLLFALKIVFILINIHHKNDQPRGLVVSGSTLVATLRA